jgi:hypothetical protein
VGLRLKTFQKSLEGITLGALGETYFGIRFKFSVLLYSLYLRPGGPSWYWPRLALLCPLMPGVFPWYLSSVSISNIFIKSQPKKQSIPITDDIGILLSAAVT